MCCVSCALHVRGLVIWSYIPDIVTSAPQYVFMAWCLVYAQGQLYLLHFIHARILTSTVQYPRFNVCVKTESM